MTGVPTPSASGVALTNPGRCSVAAHRVTEHSWHNIRLITAPVATAPIGGLADAALVLRYARHLAIQTDTPP